MSRVISRSTRGRRVGFAWAMLAGAGLLVSCGKHGAYTQSHKDAAQQRQAQIRAATDWDMAKQQYEGGDLERALRTVDASIASLGEVSKSHLLRGRILLEMGRLNDALPSFKRAIELDEANAENYYYRAVAHERMSKRDEALKDYRKAFELKPDEPMYAIAAAEMLIEGGKLDAARSLLGGESESLRYSPGVHQSLGHIAMMQKRTEEAVDHFAEASALGSQSPALLEDLARAQIAAGRFSDAESTLARLSALPDMSARRDLQHMHARCLLELGRPVDAREILLALTSDPAHANDVEAWLRMADVALILGDERQLRTVADRLIAIAPDRAEGYMCLAMWQKRSGDLPAALRSAQRAVDRSESGKAPAQLRDTIQKALASRGPASP